MAVDEIREKLSSMLDAFPREEEVSLRLRILPPFSGAESETPERVEERQAPSFEQSLGQMIDEVRRLRSSSEKQIDAMQAIVGAIEKSGGSTRAADVVAGRSLGKSTWALSPVVSGIARLFGGGEKEPAPPPPVFSLPHAVQLEAGVSRTTPGVLQEVHRGQDGLPRVAPSMGPITVNVQAMDSRSFLDHSEDIARAVREAMLSAHGLNDVVSEL